MEVAEKYRPLLILEVYDNSIGPTHRFHRNCEISKFMSLFKLRLLKFLIFSILLENTTYFIFVREV